MSGEEVLKISTERGLIRLPLLWLCEAWAEEKAGPAEGYFYNLVFNHYSHLARADPVEILGMWLVGKGPADVRDVAQLEPVPGEPDPVLSEAWDAFTHPGQLAVSWQK